MTDREAFIKSLPLRLQFHGWKIELDATQDGGVRVAQIQQPKSRGKAMGELEWEFVQQEAKDVDAQVVKEFLRTFLSTVIGQRLLTFGKVPWITRYAIENSKDVWQGKPVAQNCDDWSYQPVVRMSPSEVPAAVATDQFPVLHSRGII